MENRIKEALNKSLKIEFLEVINNSHLHAGHLGDDGSGQTHFLINIKSEDFNDLSKIQAHRKINNLLESEFKNGLHALQIKIL